MAARRGVGAVPVLGRARGVGTRGGAARRAGAARDAARGAALHPAHPLPRRRALLQQRHRTRALA